MKVSDCVKRFDGLITPAWCDLYKDYVNHLNKKPLLVGGGRLQKDIRNVEGYTFSSTFLKNAFYLPKEEKKDMVSKILFYYNINKSLTIPLLNYRVWFSSIDFDLTLLQVDFLKYGIDGKYEVHSDQGPDSRDRLLTVIINLNEEYEGAEFEFYNPSNQKELIRQEKLKKGSVLMFPSNFLFPHSIKPITKGERYSLVCWLG